MNQEMINKLTECVEKGILKYIEEHGTENITWFSVTYQD